MTEISVSAEDSLEWDLAPPELRRSDAIVRYLRDNHVVDGGSVARATQVASRTGQPIEQVLNQLGSLSDEALVRAYEAVCGFEVWDAEDTTPDEAGLDVGVAPAFLRRKQVMPVGEEDDALLFAAIHPLDPELVAALSFATKRRVRLLAARPGDLRRALALAQPDLATEQTPDALRLAREIDLISDASAEGAGARLVQAALDAAILRGASDIHFEPQRTELQVRLRIDGQMVLFERAAIDVAGPAVSRVKVIAGLDLGEKRIPQDGRTSFVVQGRSVDVRVATSPTVFGESAVLRLLDRQNVALDLDALGIEGDVRQTLERMSETAHGLFLISGPTGSGKTTTLYALLQRMQGSARKILSVEDPVEYHFEHVSQTQVAPQIGLTFATALRSFLRQDPDVILVGEIRDPETAAVAVQAAMTGHLVLASVHANSAAGVAPRLLDMGVEPFQLAAGLKGAAAQRLVRRLCRHCRQRRPAREDEKEAALALGGVVQQVFDADGCPQCQGSGFKGRVAIVEAFLANDDYLRSLLNTQHQQPIWRTMAQDGVEKVAAGVTTLEEVARAVGE
jgi:general secretion pathway protein E